MKKLKFLSHHIWNISCNKYYYKHLCNFYKQLSVLRHKLEEDEEILMESNEEGLLATNLIEELSG